MPSSLLVIFNGLNTFSFTPYLLERQFYLIYLSLSGVSVLNVNMEQVVLRMSNLNILIVEFLKNMVPLTALELVIYL